MGRTRARARRCGADAGAREDPRHDEHGRLAAGRESSGARVGRGGAAPVPPDRPSHRRGQHIARPRLDGRRRGTLRRGRSPFHRSPPAFSGARPGDLGRPRAERSRPPRLRTRRRRAGRGPVHGGARHIPHHRQHLRPRHRAEQSGQGRGDADRATIARAATLFTESVVYRYEQGDKRSKSPRQPAGTGTLSPRRCSSTRGPLACGGRRTP